MKSIKIESGEFCVLIRCDNEDIVRVIKKEYQHFISNRKEDFIIHLIIHNKFINIQNNFVYFDEGSLTGRIDLSKNRGEFHLKAYDKNRFLFILKVCFSIICSKNNSLLLHSAGVIDGDKAYLFCGPQSAGKSTIPMLLSHCKLLSDEHVIVKKINNKFKAFGTVLGGEYFKFGKILKPNNLSADIDKIFFIKQANKHKVTKKKLSGAVYELLNEDFFYFGVSKERSDLLRKNFDMIDELARKVGIYDLYFQKNAGLWQSIRDLKE